MNRLVILWTLLVSLSPLWAAQGNFSTKNPEKVETEESSDEAPTKTFTDQIKSVRVYGDDYDVFFMENGGPYEVPYSFPQSKSSVLPEELINEAYKNGSTITVTVDNKTDTLISISSQSERNPASEGSPKHNPLPKELEAYKDIIQNALSPKK